MQEFFTSLLRVTLEWLWEMFQLAIDFLRFPASFLLDTLFDAFPDSVGIAQLQQFLGFIDVFVDVELVLSFSAAFLSWWGTLTTYKVVKSWFPTVSSS